MSDRDSTAASIGEDSPKSFASFQEFTNQLSLSLSDIYIIRELRSFLLW